MTKSTMIHIDAPHFSAGCVVVGHCVDRAAPIIKFMIGWTRGDVLAYCEKKGYPVIVTKGSDYGL
jgi:hypothetical protein